MTLPGGARTPLATERVATAALPSTESPSRTPSFRPAEPDWARLRELLCDLLLAAAQAHWAASTLTDSDE